MAQTQEVRGVQTSIYTDESGINVVYRGTHVVTFNDGEITLRTGGWKTNTTKTRMNQAANQFNLGFGVFQKNHKWFIDTKAGTFEFAGDEIDIDRETGKPTRGGV